MSALSYAVADTATMFRRNLRHTARQPGMLLVTVVVPVIMLAMFGFFLGGTLAAGMGLRSGGAGYIAYLLPGMFILVASMGAGMTAYAVSLDMSKGIVARFRTMAIARTSVLVGHVAGSILRTLIGCVFVAAAAFALGVRPSTGPWQWLGALGLIVLMAAAIAWLAVALGLAAKSPETANSPTLLLQLLLFMSSAFVRPDSMPGPLGWFAQYQPFTPIVESVRAQLFGGHPGTSGWQAVGWCVGLILVAFVWANVALQRDPTR